jgi:YjbE family integral membrane protein
MLFADELAAGLVYDENFEVSIDRQAIHEGEDWKKRLGALIAGADTVVFILSPKSATSPICQWEVDEANLLSKRVVPVQASSLDGVQPPPQLAALNYVRFDPQDDGQPRSFMAGLQGLRRALTTDLDWVREHTRLLLRAHEWVAAGKTENRLLSGSDIAEAKQWLQRRPKNAPAPADLHLDFIRACETAEAARADAIQQQHREISLAQSAREQALEERTRALAESEAAQEKIARWQGRMAWLLGAAGVLILVLLSNPETAQWFATSISENVEPLATIVAINLLLAGDPRRVVDLIVARVPRELRSRVIFWGIGAAVLQRVVIAGICQLLLSLVGLTAAAGVIFLYVAYDAYRRIIALSAPPKAIESTASTSRLDLGYWSAIRKMLAADFAASFGVLVAVAGAAGSSTLVLYIGLSISVAVMAVASGALSAFLARYSLVAWIGLLLMVWVALDMIYRGSHEFTCEAYEIGCSETIWQGLLHRWGGL